MLCGQAEEVRELNEHLDLDVRKLTVLDERQRALEVLEDDLEGLAALMREIRERDCGLRRRLAITGGDEQALRVSEDVRAFRIQRSTSPGPGAGAATGTRRPPPARGRARHGSNAPRPERR